MIIAHPVLWVCLFCLTACSSEGDTPRDLTYEFKKPANFPEPTYTFDNNTITKEGFLLGRKLFFDPKQSRDGSVSCNNCHQQSKAFADSEQHPVSVGIDDLLGIRNAPSLTNLAFFKEFFWDGGVTHLDFVPINAIESEVEMDEDLANLVRKLKNDSEYPELFLQAFGTEEVTSPYILHALSQFTLMMVSSNSAYDKYVRNEGQILSETEMAGLQLFKQKCSSCHSGELFTDFTYRNNGLDSEFTDTGRARITESRQDEGKFRVPSLRNVELTSPYMHDGRFKTLEAVLDHYSEGVVISPTLDEELKGNTSLGISMNEDEKSKIIAFLKTLTDREFISDSKFHNR